MHNDLVNVSGFNGKYDYIFLSNILDYIFNLSDYTKSLNGKNDLLEYKKLIIKLSGLLTEEGRIVFHYLWVYKDNNLYYGIYDFLHHDPHYYNIKFSNSDGMPRDFDTVFVV